MLEKAKALALAAHADDVDKQGMPYWYHLANVAYGAAVHGEIYEVVGWLHDIVEDTDVTVEDIEAGFGLEVAAAVEAVTKRPYEKGRARYNEYLDRVKGNEIALKVKLADIAHNTDPTRGAVPGNLAGKYADAKRYLEGA